ncbi:MAG: hypothetical protein Q8P02_01560 [Candidatus Micrarchaeota archaeon]|nr:hypothetical protein [Candidatus Micrarchaeota archaeon]
MAGETTNAKLKRLEKRILDLQKAQNRLADFEKRTESAVERKVYEIKAVTYVTLVISSVLLALVLGMILSALGVRIG